MRLSSEPTDDDLSRMFTALGDTTRRNLVARLSTGDATVGELAQPYEMSMQAISKHLKVLEDAGLVTKTKHAQRRTVHLEAEVFDLMTLWIERYRLQAEQRYRRLDAVLAEINDVATIPRTATTPTKPSTKTSTRTTKKHRSTP